MAKKVNALTKARSLLKKADRAHTPSSIKKKLRKAGAPKGMPSK